MSALTLIMLAQDDSLGWQSSRKQRPCCIYGKHVTTAFFYFLLQLPKPYFLLMHWTC